MKGAFITIFIVHRHIKGGHIHSVEGPNAKEIHWLSNEKSNMIWGRRIIFEAL